MKRRVARCFLLLTLGAITSIALAELIYIDRIGKKPFPTPTAYGLATIDGREWVVTLMSGAGWGGISAIHAEKTGSRDEAAQSGLFDSSIIPSWARRYVTHPQTGASAAGWPWYCMTGCGYTNLTGANELHDEGLIELPIQRRGFPIRLLARPYRPGLLADTALFAPIWWFLIFGIAATRRWRRRTQGRCTACGYDLRGTPSGVCPECGAAAATNA